jgi:phosphotriesterase-related protein
MPVMTVNGPIEAGKLGVTLPHEHLFVDLRFTWKEPADPARRKVALGDVGPEHLHLLRNDLGAIRSNLVLDDTGAAVQELDRFKTAGGGTIVEVSSLGAGRRAGQFRAVSRKTGVHVVAGSGFYIRESLPPEVLQASEEELARRIIVEMQSGIDRTGIRPGIIGEVGVSAEIGEWDRKSLRAAARAQKETGRAISVHIQAVPTLKEFSGGLNGMEALRILEEAGADIERVIIGHTDAKTDTAYLRKIMAAGAYAEMDHFGKDLYFAATDFLMDRDMDRVLAIRDLVEAGFARRLLVSQDICLKTDLVRRGGHGYAHIMETVVPMMLRKGISTDAIRTIMQDNPRTLLDVSASCL